VARLAGCLGDLPKQLRLVLELRTGLGRSHALSPRAAARYLHLPVRQVVRLERRAVRLLRLTARKHACGPSPAQMASLGIPAAVLAGGQPPSGAQAIGGVKAARYTKLPSTPGSRTGGALGATNSLGISRAPGASNLLLATLLVLAGMIVIAALFAEELGVSPRYRRWQARHTRRPPR
jgi:hypothetical protein